MTQLSHKDAELILKMYELRREDVMRKSRGAIFTKFFPKSYEDVTAVLQPQHELNAAYRQVGSYWEMVYGIAKHGIVHADYLAENNGEGIFLFAKVQPYLAQIRKDYSPMSFQNAEWITTNCETGKRILERAQLYVAKMTEGK